MRSPLEMRREPNSFSQLELKKLGEKTSVFVFFVLFWGDFGGGGGGLFDFFFYLI